MTPQFLKTIPGEDPVITEAEFQASPARLFKAWTEPDEIRAWFGRAPNSVVDAAIDLRVGGSWRFAFSDTPGAINALCGEYIEIAPDRKLVFTWVHQQSSSDGTLQESSKSQVTVLLESRGSGARLTVRHESILQESGRLGVSEGWNYGLASLLAMLEAEQLAGASARS